MRDLSRPQHSTAVSPRDETVTLAGSLGFLALLAGALLAVSYPFVAVALFAGAVTGSIVRRGVGRIRRRRTPSALRHDAGNVRTGGRDLQRQRR